VITPTSAHTLTSRAFSCPQVLQKITVSFSEPADSIRFVSDGQVHEILDPKTKVEILKSDYTIPLIDFNDTDYFNTLRVKMGWGKRGDQTI
jgi:Predicted sugar kinase